MNFSNGFVRCTARSLVLCAAVWCGAPPVCAQSPPPASSNPPTPQAPEFPRREFSFDAPRGQTFRWTSQPIKDGERVVREGLHYTWSLPSDLEAAKACDLLIVCHPVGKDCTWAPAALNRGQLGSRILIAPDGTSVITKGVRTFRADNADILAFREFVLEMTQAFPADRIYLCGFEQGGSFALSFAGYFPGLAEGVVAIASEAWAECPTKGGVQQVPLVFLHGTADERSPLATSVATRDTYAADDHPMLWLRPLHGAGHEPSARAIAQGLDWCDGMIGTQAADVLAAAKRLLHVQDHADNTNRTTPALGRASEVLRRLLGESENNPAHEPLEEVPEAVRAEAAALLGRVNGHAALHIASILRDITDERQMILNGKPWLGHMMTLREDCRGVPAVERFVLRCGFDRVRIAHTARLAELHTAMAIPSPKARFEAVLDVLPACFAADWCTPPFFADLKNLRARASDLGLSEESVERYEFAELLQQSLQAGIAQYQATLNEWVSDPVKQPPPRPR